MNLYISHIEHHNSKVPLTPSFPFLQKLFRGIPSLAFLFLTLCDQMWFCVSHYLIVNVLNSRSRLIVRPIFLVSIFVSSYLRQETGSVSYWRDTFLPETFVQLLICTCIQLIQRLYRWRCKDESDVMMGVLWNSV